MTELHHFHPTRKGSGSLRPFPIYPLYTRAVILSLDKPIADCFLFRSRKTCEKRRKRSYTNVSNTSATQTSRVSPTPLQTPLPYFHYYTVKMVLAQSSTNAPRLRSLLKLSTPRLHSKNRTQRLTRRNTGLRFCHCVACFTHLSHTWAKKGRRKRMHAYGVCPLPPASRPSWAA